ncbi:hypothetical protein CC80DRAFT_33768 [Byssothecium circinans]|uniref:Uncharacterized protein n=1 Tax=Byssothecium circinans TaxID=147558 RepID=A0A6A5TYS3_9PLEO|nr:hypothetical protein CC80DRAFT_33768 [Byssothecium circinans]
MSFDLDTLFGDADVDTCPDLGSSGCPSSASSSLISSALLHDDHAPTCDDLDNLGDMIRGIELRLEQDQVIQLIKERDDWRAQAHELAKRVVELEKRMASKAATGPPMDPDFVARLNSLERENRRLVTDNLRLKDELQDVERKNSRLCNDNEGKSRKLRGANKKAKNAKDVAVKEEGKAKDAVNERDQRLKLQREQKKMMQTAQAELTRRDLIIQGLQSDLHAERSGAPHLRHDASTADETIAAFSVSLKINRRHFPLVKSMLADSQSTMTSRIEGWYEQFKKPRAEKIVGAVYVDAPDTRIGVDLNDDLVEILGGHGGPPHTGAEHSGRRSMHGLEAIARNAMDAHNCAS